jgi:outer membrane protein
MFKKFLLAVLVAVPMCIQAQTVKLGAVNPTEILNVMPEFATMKNTLNELSGKYETQAKALQDEFNKKQAELETLTKGMAKPESDPTAMAKAKELEDLYTRYQNFMQTAQQDIQKQQETLMAPIQQKLMTAITAVGAEGGFAGILDSATLLYQGNNIEDISAKVKAKLGIK